MHVNCLSDAQVPLLSTSKGKVSSKPICSLLRKGYIRWPQPQRVPASLYTRTQPNWFSHSFPEFRFWHCKAMFALPPGTAETCSVPNVTLTFLIQFYCLFSWVYTHTKPIGSYQEFLLFFCVSAELDKWSRTSLWEAPWGTILDTVFSEEKPSTVDSPGGRFPPVSQQS